MHDSERNEKATILIADDDAVNRSIVEAHLSNAGYSVVTACNGREAIDKAVEVRPDVIILDVMMPGMDGFEACAGIKSNAATAGVPVIFLSSREEIEIKVSGLQLGANDFINKPFRPQELVARVEVAIRVKRERDQLREAADEARASFEIAQEMAMTDALTGLLNRYGLQRTMAHWISHARRHNRPLSCVMADLDHFKLVNDLHGHAAGDLVLQQIAAVLKETVRSSDTVFRLGGEEFVVLLPDTELKGAAELSERVRATCEQSEFGGGAGAFHVTLSLGVSELGENESGNDMIARADMALYRAKEKGRNRSELAE